MAFGLAVAAALASPPTSGAQAVTVKPLGWLGNDASGFRTSTARGVNDAGQVTGTSTSAGTFGEAFRTGANGDNMRGLGSLPFAFPRSEGNAINAAGRVVGTSVGQGFLTIPFLQNQLMVGVGFLPTSANQPRESNAYGVNALGQVTGMSTVGDFARQAYVTDANGLNMRGLGWLSGDVLQPEKFSAGMAVNDLGQVTGASSDVDGYAQAFLTRRLPIVQTEVMLGLGFLSTNGPGDPYSIGRGVNVSGQVVGQSRDAQGRRQAFLTDAGGLNMRGLGFGGAMTNPGCINSMVAPLASVAYGVNDAGTVVGSVFGYWNDPFGLRGANGRYCGSRAFVYTATNGMRFFDELLAASGTPGWYVDDAHAISNTGYVAATGTNQGLVDTQGLLLRLTPSAPSPVVVSPVPEPGTWALLGTGLLPVGGTEARSWSRTRA